MTGGQHRLSSGRGWLVAAAGVLVVGGVGVGLSSVAPGSADTVSPAVAPLVLPTVDPLPVFKEAKPSISPSPTPSARPSVRPTPKPSPSTKPPVPLKPSPTWSTTRPSPVSPTTVAPPPVRPVPTPPVFLPAGASWYVSVSAQAAAEEMRAADAVGHPDCVVSSGGGPPDVSAIPAGVSRVGVGQSGAYFCLVF